MKRSYLVSTILVIVLLMTAGCGLLNKGKEVLQDASEDTQAQENTQDDAGEEAEAEATETKLGDYQVMFAGEVVEEGEQFIINGQSNLIPGSRLVGEVVLDEGETVFSDTSELVAEDGTFYMELDHHKYGEAEVIIRFDFDNVQDDEMKRHYGEKGQKMEGPFIYRHKTFNGIFQKAEVRMDYKANEENNLVIAAPEWLEKPDDYGDPRVWIEVDELTEDGEFFYLHGHSNLIEGSEIKVEYQYNRDTTQVNPDGSFDFKFDYEYLEDKDIVITFEPSGFQWNEIEEAYGKNGQNLVGNLVQTKQFNTDVQYVEKRTRWDSEKGEMKSEEAKQDKENGEDEDKKQNNDEDEK